MLNIHTRRRWADERSTSFRLLLPGYTWLQRDATPCE